MLKRRILTLILMSIVAVLLVACGGNTTTGITTETPTTNPTTNPTTTPTTTTEEPEITLPDLTNKTKAEIILVLDELSLNYSFKYRQTTDVSEDIFIGYGNELVAGNTVSVDTEVEVILATESYVLPDLSGLTQSEIFLLLLGKGVLFTFEVEVNNDVPNQTFSSYGNDLEAGDKIDSQTQLIIYIGFNTAKLPDLTGKLKGEIEKVLTENQIQYAFEYVIDDNYPEDSFVEYKDFEIGDYYEEGVVNVVLYKNTFTDNATSLIISKYVDGGNDTQDQAIEIYNPTDSTVFLGDYHLALYNNGSYEATNIINFKDVDLLPGETYVIANKASTNGNLLKKADEYFFELNFDGNDTIQLRYKNNTYIDSIYHIGNTDFVMDNEVYIRKANVVKGARDYVFTQWNAYIPTYIGTLGIHPVSTPSNITFTFINRPFYDLLGGMDNVTLYSINDGDTASFSPGFTDSQRVRFLGVDTPETYPITDPWGPAAKAYTTFILNNAIDIYIQSDPDLGYTESYGRHLGLVWVNLGETGLTINIEDDDKNIIRTEHLSGWILLNYQLVLNGFSYNYYGSASKLVFDNRYLYRWFQDAQLSAQENGYGIHG